MLSLGSIVTAERIPVGGEAIDHAVIQHLRQQHELMLPSQSVRPLQLALSGNGLTLGGPAMTEIHGRDVATGLARSVQVDTAAVRRAIHTPLTAVLDGIGKVLRDCPPDLVADLADRGIMMVGGSALLPGLDQMLRDATGMPVHIAERPDVCCRARARRHAGGQDRADGPRPARRLRPPGASDCGRDARTAGLPTLSSASWAPTRRSPAHVTRATDGLGRALRTTDPTSPTCSPPA